MAVVDWRWPASIIGIVLVVLCVAFWIYFATNADCVRNGSSWDCTTN